MPHGSPIEQVISRFIDEQLAPDDTPVDGDENLLTGGRIDSVGVMRLVAHLESTLHVAIPPSDLIPQNFRTVRIMAAYLEGIGARAPGVD